MRDHLQHNLCQPLYLSYKGIHKFFTLMGMYIRKPSVHTYIEFDPFNIMVVYILEVYKWALTNNLI